MKNALWKLLAFIVSRRFVADYLIGRATATPYFHLAGYMGRWWLFNRYSVVGSGEVIEPRFKFLPSVRIHHILRADLADHMHDHPWNARTIILRGGYTESRPSERDHEMMEVVGGWPAKGESFVRRPGDTAPVLFGEYHHITEVAPLGAWTMFFTWEYAGTWGFLVNGAKVPYRDYLRDYPEREA